MEVGGAELTMYDNLHPRTKDRAWTDLCRGPHLPSTRLIPAFKLIGLQRPTGGEREEPVPATDLRNGVGIRTRNASTSTCWRRPKSEITGASVWSWTFQLPEEIGSGLAVFHPRGGVIRREMEEYSRRQHEKSGEFVNTPHITKSALFEKSGHLGGMRTACTRRWNSTRSVTPRATCSAGGGRVLPQADELSDAQPDL